MHGIGSRIFANLKTNEFEYICLDSRPLAFRCFAAGEESPDIHRHTNRQNNITKVNDLLNSYILFARNKQLGQLVWRKG
jgi:hypothetical protein